MLEKYLTDLGFALCMEILLYILKQLLILLFRFFIMSGNTCFAFQNFVKQLEVLGKVSHLQYCRSSISLEILLPYIITNVLLRELSFLLSGSFLVDTTNPMFFSNILNSRMERMKVSQL